MSPTGHVAAQAKVLSRDREDCSDMEQNHCIVEGYDSFYESTPRRSTALACSAAVGVWNKKGDVTRRQWRRDLIASLKLPYCLLQYFSCGRMFWVHCNWRDWCNAQANSHLLWFWNSFPIYASGQHMFEISARKWCWKRLQATKNKHKHDMKEFSF